MKTRATILLAVALLGGDWPDWSADAGRTRASSGAVGTSLTPLWSRNVAERIVASPVTADGAVVIATEAGTVTALRESDGAVLWSFAAGGHIYSTPLLRTGVVYAATVNGNIHARSLADGSALWSVSLGAPVHSSIKELGGRLIVGTGNPASDVRALDPATGATAWISPVYTSVLSSAAADGASFWIGGNAGKTFKLDAATGALQSTITTPVGGDVLMRSPLVAFGQVFALPGGSDMDFRSLGAWSLTMTDPSPPTAGVIRSVRLDGSSPAVAGSLVSVVVRFGYFIDTDGNGYDDLYGAQEYAVGVDPGSQTVAWRTLLGSRFGAYGSIIPTLGLCPTPASIDGGARLVVGSSMDANLRLLDAATGAVVNTVAADGPGRSSPAVSNSRVLWGTDAGTLYCYQGSANSAPTAPIAGFTPSGPPTFTTSATSLAWSAGADAEDAAAALSYVVRLDSDGEILQDWSHEIVTAAGITTAALSPVVAPPGTYTWAVRTVDSDGALSAWSASQSFTSVVNPDPPTGLAAAPSIGSVGLTWNPSPTVGVVGYRVRWSSGGGPVDTTGLSLMVSGLINGSTYTFEVRAVDPDGDESVPAVVNATPTDVGIVSVAGVAYPGLAPALAAAPPGSTILVGRGIYAVPPGMTLRGMSLIGISPHDTWLDAGGLGTAITVVDDAAHTPMTLSNFSLYGADIGIEIQSGTVTLTHLILRQMGTDAVLITGPADVRIVNNTIVFNGDAAVDKRDGTVAARNNLLLHNGTGLQGSISSSTNDLYGNAAADYDGCERGPSDFSADIFFLDADAGDFREHGGQIHIDAGDEGDPYDLEPSPNGGRINVGAYGNTPWAATSGASGAGPGGGGCVALAAPHPGSTLPWAAALAALLFLFSRPRRFE